MGILDDKLTSVIAKAETW